MISQNGLGWCVLVLILVLQLSAEAQFIPSEKWKDLSCEKLEKQSLFTHLSQNFSELKNHLPIKNYSFNFGFYSLANCWSLAHLQRLYFYLHENRPVKTEVLADTIRGFSVFQDKTSAWKNFAVKPQVLSDFGGTAWAELSRGYIQRGEFGGAVRRTLHSELEAYQVSRFHDLRNVEFLLGEIPRTPVENLKTMDVVRRMLGRNRLPLILLRPQIYSQHVVVAKRIEKNKIVVYDSNTPETEGEIYFDEQTKYFYAPQIVRGLPMVTNEFAPIGVFIVDSGDLDPIQEVLYGYYKDQCQRN